MAEKPLELKRILAAVVQEIHSKRVAKLVQMEFHLRPYHNHF